MARLSDRRHCRRGGWPGSHRGSFFCQPPSASSRRPGRCCGCPRPRRWHHRRTTPQGGVGADGNKSAAEAAVSMVAARSVMVTAAAMSAGMVAVSPKRRPPRPPPPSGINANAASQDAQPKRALSRNVLRGPTSPRDRHRRPRHVGRRDGYRQALDPDQRTQARYHHRSHVVGVTDELAKTRGKVTADRCKTALSTFFVWCIDQGYCGLPPRVRHCAISSSSLARWSAMIANVRSKRSSTFSDRWVGSPPSRIRSTRARCSATRQTASANRRWAAA